MADIKANEREFSGQVVVWLNELISSGSYPFENITGETSVKTSGESTKFPDVKIWLNRSTKQGFCDIEAKTPTTPADDQTLLEKFPLLTESKHTNPYRTYRNQRICG